MQVKRAPIIPKKPQYLSSNDPISNSNTECATTFSTVKQSERELDSSSQRQGSFAPAQPGLSPSFQQPKRAAKRRVRPTPNLTLQHLYLYSSSFPGNLLDTKDVSGSSVYANSYTSRQRSSSSVQQSTQFEAKVKSETPPKKPTRRPSAPSLTNPPSQSSQWSFRSLENDQLHVHNPTAKTYNFDESMPSHHAKTPVTQHTVNSTSGITSKYDPIIAHLVDMGFDVTEAKHAVQSSNDHSLQGALDILVQRKSTTGHPPGKQKQQEEQNQQKSPSEKPDNFQKRKVAFESSTISANLSSNQEPRQPYTSNDDDSSSDDDENDLVKEQEWQRQQDIRRREYLNSLKEKRKSNEPSFASSHSEQAFSAFSTTKMPHDTLHKTTNEHATTNHSSSATVPPFSTSAAKSATQTTATPLSSTSRPIFNKNNNAPVAKPISPDVIKKAIKSRARGNDLFKLGYYGEAEKSYTQALALLPVDHDVTIIISNNRAATRLKSGKYQQCISDCTLVIHRARQRCQREVKGSVTLLEGSISIRWHDQLSKAMHRKAESLEKLLLTSDALQVYEELIKMDSNDMKAQQGRQRCQSIIDASKPPPPPPPRRSAPTANHTSNTTTASSSSSSSSAGAFSTAFPGLDYSIFETKQTESKEPPSKAVAAMRARQAEMAKEENERLEKADVVNARIDAWKRGKEKNIRALLSSLDTLLWPGAQWRGAPINELLEPKKVKISYMKAISKVHPDKLPSSTSVEQRLLASGIFSVLNQAWDDFRTNNKM